MRFRHRVTRAHGQQDKVKDYEAWGIAYGLLKEALRTCEYVKESRTSI